MDLEIAKHYKEPEGRQKALAQFNKITGEFTAILQYVDPETLNNEYFDYREVEFDFSRDELVGTRDDFKIVDRDELPPEIFEESLDSLARSKITKRYPVIQQVNVITRAIMRLSEKAGVDQEELLEMVDYINEVKHANNVRKEYYSNSPDFNYRSYADVEAERERQLEGGLHEVYGPQPTSGGRIF